jgi:nitrogen fixation protein NifU and related proteins
MSELTDLYQEVILDHGKRPRNFGPLPAADRRAEGLNPLCGDHLTVALKVGAGGAVEDVRFEGTGCAISRASASVMTGLVKGKRPEEIEAMFQVFHRLVTEGAAPGQDPESLGKLAVFGGVHEFPSRVKCASLGWHTLRAALQGGATASTE